MAIKDIRSLALGLNASLHFITGAIKFAVAHRAAVNENMPFKAMLRALVLIRSSADRVVGAGVLVDFRLQFRSFHGRSSISV